VSNEKIQFKQNYIGLYYENNIFVNTYYFNNRIYFQVGTYLFYFCFKYNKNMLSKMNYLPIQVSMTRSSQPNL